MQAVVVIPTYNERDNLCVLIDQIQNAVSGLHVLIVDDNSPDGTGELADRLAASNRTSIFVLHRTGKSGLGTAYVAGFKWAIAHGYDLILQMDADLSHDPAALPQLISQAADSDLVIGSRYVNGINVVGWDFRRLLISKCASLYVRLITGMPVTDSTGGFKCWRRSTLVAIGLNTLFSNGYLFQIETTYKALRRGLTFTEQPIIFYERRLGKSKFDWHIVTEAVWGVLRLRIEPWLHFVSARKPEEALTSSESSVR